MDAQQPTIPLKLKQISPAVLLRQTPIVEIAPADRVPLLTEIPPPPDTSGLRESGNHRKLKTGIAQATKLTQEQIHAALSYRLVGRWSIVQLCAHFRLSQPTMAYKLGLYAKKTGYWKALQDAADRGKGVRKVHPEGPMPSRVLALAVRNHPSLQDPIPLFQGVDNSEVLATKAEAVIDKALTMMNDPDVVAKMSPTMLLAVVKELVPIMQLLRGKATQNITKHTLAQRISIIYEKRVRAPKPADAKVIETEFAKVDA